MADTTKLRLEIDSKLYTEYKTLAESQAFAVTKLNNILMEKAIKQWITENKK